MAFVDDAGEKSGCEGGSGSSPVELARSEAGNSQQSVTNTRHVANILSRDLPVLVAMTYLPHPPVLSCHLNTVFRYRRRVC